MDISDEDWDEVSKILEESFSDEMEGENVPEFTATKINDSNTCTNSQPETEENVNTHNKQQESCSPPVSKCENTDSDSDSDINIPLAELITKRHLRAKRSLFQSNNSDNENESEFDDDVRDPTYEIHKKDLSNSDSDTDSYEIEIPLRQRKIKTKTPVSHKPCRNISARDKNWKRKPSALSRKKRVTPGRPSATKHLHRAIQRAKQESYNMQRARNLLKEKHRQNLDDLLASNGLKRKTVYGDGNCLFKAILMSTNEFTSADLLRQKLCDHFSENKQTYIGFIAAESNACANDQQRMYIEKVNYLREEGHWSNELADAIPLAIANLLGKTLKIYCSNRANPVYEIQPDLQEPKQGENDTVNLALFQIPGFEHYDACSKLEDSEYQGPQEPEATLPETSRAPSPSTSAQIETVYLTPRKQACYRSPHKTNRKRKRIAEPAKWKKNVRKHRRLHGLDYVSTAGKKVSEKKLKDATCNCRFKCNENFSYDERNRIFQDYWGLGSYQRQKDFLCSNITEDVPSRVRTQSSKRRVRARVYRLDKKRVCKDFFRKTLDIGGRVIDTALKSQSSGSFASFDMRGRHTPHNRTPDVVLQDVRKHIQSFPKVEAHYTRKDTKRQFLDSDLNITKMYALYEEKCKETGKQCVSSSMYRKIFCEEYNYSFHIPKKDQCQTCAVYRNKEDACELTADLQLAFEEHIKRKNRAREEKMLDKTRAIQEKSYHVATFDLEAVLPVPCSLVSQVYYKRKLSCYNLSFYSLQNSSSTCFLWNETEGQRGSCEVGTCLLTYIKSLPLTVKNVCLYSDCCSGQNRNRVVTVALMHALEKCKNIETIEQKFLESGHTQMESDSVHAAVERAKKLTSVYVPSQWDTIVRMARKRNPYVVVPMKHYDFLDIKHVTKSVLPPNVVNISGQRVLWTKIKWIKLQKSEPGCVFIKYDFDDGNFDCVKLKSSRKGPSVKCDLQPLYDTKLPIAAAKKKDLLSLCSDGIIPSEYHQYFKDIPAEKAARDCLPEPDALEESEDSEC